ECKKASPSKGLIAPHFPYVQIAKEYEAAGADCISVLTEPKWFLGSDTYLQEIAEAVSIPCLRKDFTVDAYMIYEAKLLNASAVLLICSILSEEEIREYIGVCDELGLSIILTHNSADRLINDTDELIEDHRILNCPNIGIGGFFGDRTPEGVRKFLSDCRPAMEKIAAAGMKFQYHNHGFEFEKFDGVTLFDILKNESDPELMGFTLDTYWVQYGGVCIVDLVNSLRGRINVFHFKDMAMTPEGQHFAPIGEGNLSWDTIIPAFAQAGAEYGFVEQDNTYGADPFDCLGKSYNYLAGKL
ncbi:MAG: TIM barrel protein, partial [Eubacteriales bacterium]